MTGPVAATAAAVRSGRVSAEQAVEQALRRIAERDPGLGAVVAVRPQAVAEARALDRAWQDGSTVPGPLAGVPVLVKDSEDVAGTPTRSGSQLPGRVPEVDGRVPSRLRAAGAVVVGKSALPEFAIEGFTHSLRHGPTRNPWNLERSPGGSSGGSGAALAAGMVPVATATDGGGSVRIPAAFCGLLGLKPTHGLVGNWPVADWIDLSTSGVLAADAGDLALLLGLLSGVTAGDPASAPAPAAGGVAANRLLAAERTSPLGPLPAPVASRWRSGVERLGEVLGLPVRWLSPDEVFAGLGDPDQDWFLLAGAEHVAALSEQLGDRDRVQAAAAGGLLHPSTVAFLSSGLGVAVGDYLAARRRRTHYCRRFDDLLQAGGLLVTPTVAADAWLPDGRRTPGAAPGPLPPEVYSTAVQNITGHPALSLPWLADEAGVPSGLQVTAERWRDDLLLEVATLWQREVGWAPGAPGYSPWTV